MPMPKKVIDEAILGEWIRSFYDTYKRSPRSEDLAIVKGCPYGREVIYKKYTSLDILYERFGLISRSKDIYLHLEEDLKRIKSMIYRHRTTNHHLLKQHGIRDREYYKSRFGSWANAVMTAGVTNTERVLIRYFDNYTGQDPIEFLKRELGVDGDFTNYQKEIISKVKRELFGATANKIQGHISPKKLKAFRYPSLLMISSGMVPNPNYKTGIRYVSKDGDLCDSSQEMELDNWLYERNIEHECHVGYPESRMICDFKVGSLYIEYAGLWSSGRSNYIDKINKKIDHCKTLGLRIHIVKNLTDKETELLEAALAGDCY